MEDTVSKYLFTIEEVKKRVKFPVIASVNCISADEWHVFAKRLESAGADALELNLFILPSDLNRSAEANEKIYFDVLKKVKADVKIPVSLKISFYFSNLAQMIVNLGDAGADGIVLFNRFYSPDIDIDKMEIVPADVISSPSDLYNSLRWIAIMSGKAKCDLASSTGVHDGNAAIKQLLAGATAVQVASALYKNGIDYPAEINHTIEDWMKDHGYKTVDDFRGKLSYTNAANPAAYERVQFMRHFSGKSCVSIPKW
jgi:dihydroorotate dehydrogenase (fumarate)